MKKKAATASAQATKKTISRKPAGVAPTVAKSSSNHDSSKGLWMDKNDLERLQDHLREAQETLDAIRNGDVDAVVVNGSHGSQVYSLSGAEEPYRIYVEQMQEGAVTVGGDGLVLYSNQRFADMSGYPLERVISSQILQYLPADAWQDLLRLFELEQGVVKHECLLHHVDGGPRPVLLTGSRLPMDLDDVMCLVITDLSEQKEREILRRDKKGAEKANMAKDAFLAALSHELRTPLTPALMATMALEHDTSLPDATRASLGMIRRNIELEARLIDDLLDLTRIARGKLEMNLQGVDLHAVILRAVEICETDINVKRHTLHLHLNAAACYIHADSVRLQQALWNVIRNAVKFTPLGGEITILTDNPTENRVRIQVKDTGVGFSSDLKTSMFKPFEQGGQEITRRFGGLGLGLAISHSILESHQGSIEGHSEGAGLGAVFTLELPIGTPMVKRHQQAPIGPRSRHEEALNILLVEDHDDTRANMTHLLRRSGHQVTSAESAELALSLAAAESFDLVISDLGLPDLSGLDLMRELRDKYGLKGIAVSGYGMEEDIQRSYESGFVQHLTKPIHINQLRHVIQHFRES